MEKLDLKTLPDFPGVTFVREDKYAAVSKNFMAIDYAKRVVAALRELGFNADWAPDNDANGKAWVYVSVATKHARNPGTRFYAASTSTEKKTRNPSRRRSVDLADEAVQTARYLEHSVKTLRQYIELVNINQPSFSSARPIEPTALQTALLAMLRDAEAVRAATLPLVDYLDQLPS